MSEITNAKASEGSRNRTQKTTQRDNFLPGKLLRFIYFVSGTTENVNVLERKTQATRKNLCARK